MRPPGNDWPNSEGARGVLFFAQLFREMLSEETFESFRAMTLDTVSRIGEAISLADDVLRRTITQKVLDPVIDELKWSLESDPVAKLIAPNEVSAFLEQTKVIKNDPQQLVHLLHFLAKRLRLNYSSNLERMIVEKSGDPRARIELRKLSGFYCSHLVNEGHSKDYILRKVDERFFEQT